MLLAGIRSSKQTLVPLFLTPREIMRYFSLSGQQTGSASSLGIGRQRRIVPQEMSTRISRHVRIHTVGQISAIRTPAQAEIESTPPTMACLRGLLEPSRGWGTGGTLSVVLGVIETRATGPTEA